MIILVLIIQYTFTICVKFQFCYSFRNVYIFKNSHTKFASIVLRWFRLSNLINLKMFFLDFKFWIQNLAISEMTNLNLHRKINSTWMFGGVSRFHFRLNWGKLYFLISNIWNNLSINILLFTYYGQRAYYKGCFF